MVPRTNRRQRRVPARPCGGCCPDRTAGVRHHFFNGNNSIRRKNTSAPSDWNRIFPLVWLEFVPALTTTPLRMLVILSPSQMHSRVFHSPAFFSTSCLPRKPLTSFQSGSRPYQLMRPPENSLASPLGS